MKIGMTGLFVNNPLEAFAFYTNVLGFTNRMYVPEANLAIVVSPEEPDGTGLLLEPTDNPIGRNYQEALYNGHIPAIVFSTSDIHREYDRLKAAGVLFKKEPTKADWGTETVFDDTCGNWIQLVQI